MRVLRSDERRRSRPGHMRLDLLEALEPRRLLSAAGAAVSTHMAAEIEDSAPSAHSAGIAPSPSSSSATSESESHAAAQQAAPYHTASGEGDGASGAASAKPAQVVPAVTSTSKAAAPSATLVASASSPDQPTAGLSAANSPASNDGETESETSGSAAASSSSANSTPAPPASKPRPAAAAASNSGGPSDLATTPATDPNLLTARDGQPVAADAGATPQADAAKAVLKPSAAATVDAEATPHALSQVAAASLALAGNGMLSMQAALPTAQGGDTSPTPALDGAVVAVQLLESNASRQLAGAVAHLAEGALPSAQGAMAAVARLREMLSMQQFGQVAEVPQLFSLNMLSSFTDALAQFAHESALGATITQATNHHELAWAVTFVTLAADAILIGRWRAGRAKKGVVHPDARGRFSRRRIV